MSWPRMWLCCLCFSETIRQLGLRRARVECHPQRIWFQIADKAKPGMEMTVKAEQESLPHQLRETSSLPPSDLRRCLRFGTTWKGAYLKGCASRLLQSWHYVMCSIRMTIRRDDSRPFWLMAVLIVLRIRWQSKSQRSQLWSPIEACFALLKFHNAVTISRCCETSAGGNMLCCVGYSHGRQAWLWDGGFCEAIQFYSVKAFSHTQAHYD